MIRKSLLHFLHCLLLSIVVLASPAFAQLSFDYLGVTRTFRPAPVPQQVDDASRPSVNASGLVAYQGDDSLYLAAVGHAILLATLGDAAPGGGKFITATRPAINATGQIVFKATMLAPSVSGIYLYSAGKFRPLATEGMTTATGAIFGLTDPSLNVNGDCTFLTSSGVYLASKGMVRKIAMRGDSTPDGDKFSGFSHPLINASGELVFTTSLLSGNTGIYAWANGVMTKIVNSGDPAPNQGTWLSFHEAASLNDLGQVAFTGLVNGGNQNGNGIYLYSNGALSLKISFPFTASNGVVVDSANSPSLNSVGQISVLGFISTHGSEIVGIFVTSGNAIIEAMNPTQLSPDGLTYLGASTQVLSEAGQIAFAAFLVEQVRGVYLYSPSQTVRLGGKNSLVNRVHPAAFTFPEATSITQDGRALLFDFTSPGGSGLFVGKASQAMNQVQVAAHLGEPLPGGGIINQFIDGWAMNDKADIVFNAGNTLLGDEVVLASGSSFTKIAAHGDPAPDGGTFFNFGTPGINELDHIIFPGSTSTSNNLYLYQNGQLSALSSADIVQAGEDPAINDSDQVAFFSQPLSNPNGLYLFSDGVVTPIALDGDPAPGGDYYSLPYADPTFGPIINNRGDVAFSAFLAGGGEATYLYSQGVVTRVAGPGDTTPDGDTFADADYAWINDSGSIVFFADTFSGDHGVYELTGGNLVTVAHAGTVIPSVGALLDAFSTPSINASGQVAFSGDLPDGTFAYVHRHATNGHPAHPLSPAY